MATSPSGAPETCMAARQEPEEPTSSQPDGAAAAPQPAAEEQQTSDAPEGRPIEREKSVDHLTVISEITETSKFISHQKLLVKIKRQTETLCRVYQSDV